ncbi:hypothetical protein CCMSSC00406_0003214 [Pleurotus cornucopiae]|uniref:Uncharacterized protein n=1 Tax=Pleurotus cornucopiae TaxID=5321 RepID=A0ACB7J8J9_PLECO|nr:hypothetical protein CCMSSC00406_0003214 [Pleurotus cornucopiae]
MAYRGTDNLRCYIREAGLPPMLCHPSTPQMPPEGHKSHLNNLKIRPESWRKLQTIHELKENRWERRVDKYIPDESLGIEDEDKESEEMLSVPCPPTFDIPSQKLRRPADISRLSPWLENLLLTTTQRIMHILFASTLDWGFHPGHNNDDDKELFDYFLWTKNSFSPEEAFEVGYHSVLVAYQPPWILSPQDMKEFASCRSVCQCRPFVEKENPVSDPFKALNAYGQSCGILVLQSTADGLFPCLCWVFGVFTKGWTSAFVTTVYTFDDYGPTVLEHLLYWVASASRLPGSARIPQVPEPISSLGPQVVPQTNYTDFSTPAPSESNWDGKSKDAGSSAGLTDTLTPRISEVGLPHYQPRPLQTLNRSDSIAAWIRSAQANAMGFENSNSPASSNISIPNVTNQIPQFMGDWVM